MYDRKAQAFLPALFLRIKVHTFLLRYFSQRQGIAKIGGFHTVHGQSHFVKER